MDHRYNMVSSCLLPSQFYRNKTVRKLQAAKGLAQTCPTYMVFIQLIVTVLQPVLLAIGSVGVPSKSIRFDLILTPIVLL